MRHVVVSGGASGIGEAVATRLVRSGHRVTILDRRGQESLGWWRDFSPRQVGFLSLDVTNQEEVDRAVDALSEEVPLDGALTSAGIVTRGALLEQSSGDLSQTLAVNLSGTVNVVRAVVRNLVATRRSGSLVTVSSMAGMGYVAGLGVGYHVSKAAVVGLTRSVAGDYARHGIRINAIAPGVVKTPMALSQIEQQGEQRLAARAPAGRLAEPEEIAKVAEWLLSPESRLTTGYVFPVDGGQSAVTGAPAKGYPSTEVDTRNAGLDSMGELS